MSTSTGTTSLSTGAELTIPNVLVAIQDKIKTFKGIETSKFKTTMQLSGFGDLGKETKVDNLVKAYSSVKGRSEAYANAAKDLGVESYPEFVVDGGSAADWKKDISLRIQIINHKDELDKLRALEAEAKTFLSAEDQKGLFFTKLMGALGTAE